MSETMRENETIRDFEIQLRDEKITELTDIVNGTIRETGRYSITEHKFDINTSSILTRLIQEAGRWCNCYASDLFIQWKYNIDRPLEDGTIKSTKLVFAFREFGVDSEAAYNRTKDNNYHYYRAVWFLDITVTDDGKIEMVLHKKGKEI